MTQKEQRLSYQALRSTAELLRVRKAAPPEILAKWYEAKNLELVTRYDIERCSLLRDGDTETFGDAQSARVWPRCR